MRGFMLTGDIFNGVASVLALMTVAKVLTFYGVHPVANLDFWCYEFAFLVGFLVCMPMSGRKS